MAVARTLGATPGQVTAGLSMAQLLPTLPGAVSGVLLAVLFFGGPDVTMPPAWWPLTAVLVLVLATAVLTALPARVAARRPVAEALVRP
jgi:putative ABC transport system permease protein